MAAGGGSGGSPLAGYFDRGRDVLQPGASRTTHVDDDRVFCVNRTVNNSKHRLTTVATTHGLMLFDANARRRQVLTRDVGLIANHARRPEDLREQRRLLGSEPAPPPPPDSAPVSRASRLSIEPGQLGQLASESALGSDPEVTPIVQGTRLSATIGTGSAVGGGALTKTGTVPCFHWPKGSGDGHAMALAPDESPEFASLLRVHNEPGSHVAA